MTVQARPRLLLELPSGFVGLPLDESTEDNARNLRELAQRIAPAARLEPGAMVERLSVLAGVMAASGLNLFGRFPVATPDTEQPALATLAVAMPALDVSTQDTLTRNRRAAAAVLLKQHRRRVPRAEVAIVDLPIGPAVVAVTAGEYRLPATSGRPNPVVRPEFKAEFQIPAPDGNHLVMLAVTTGSEAGWPAAAAAARRVAASLRFERAEG